MDTIDTVMKSIVNLRVHIAPVGFEIDRIIIPAKINPAPIIIKRISLTYSLKILNILGYSNKSFSSFSEFL